MSSETITRDRSFFWVQIYRNDDCISIITNRILAHLIGLVNPDLINLSPTGWRLTKTHNYILWIPENRIQSDIIDDFFDWAYKANEHIWLGLNNNIDDFFTSELDFCLAADWNYNFSTKSRTTVGEAEYQIKYQYPKGRITREEAEKYAESLSLAIRTTLAILPIESMGRILVTTVPAKTDDQNKLSWKLAKYVQKKVDCEFLTATLSVDKPQTKSLKVQQKIDIWRNLFSQNQILLSHSIRGYTILIVDDLYQSGASMWSYAEFLKSKGAASVMGLVAVKSQRDSDNT